MTPPATPEAAPRVPSKVDAVSAAGVAAVASASSSAPHPGADAAWVGLPFRHSGQCAEGARPGLEEARARYFATFRPTAAWHTTVFAGPGVSAEVVAAVRDQLEPVHQLATARLGLEAEPPAIYIYPSVKELRDYSCTSKASVAYYDGAVHLPADREELTSNLRHELAHHALVSQGVSGPMWLQEGVATAFGGGCPQDSYALWRKHPLDLTQMVRGFPHTASPEDANIWTAQACVMYQFLERLCLTREPCNAQELVGALANREATPDTLFQWAIRQRGGDLFRTAKLPLWEDYVEHGDFAPATKAALLKRAGI